MLLPRPYRLLFLTFQQILPQSLGPAGFARFQILFRGRMLLCHDGIPVLWTCFYPMKPYQTIPILDCGEPLVPIPHERFVFFTPPPYTALGAPYGGASPWTLRKGLLDGLNAAQDRLDKLKPGWKIMIFDGYRPNAVQAFMVEREFALEAHAAGLDPLNLTDEDREKLGEKVFRLWGVPSENPATPPPHSTGGAIDCTLADETGKEIDMGSPIDENSDRSNPDYFADARDEKGRAAHANRILLHTIFQAEGFTRHHTEWWHFSRGDQYWAWQKREDGGEASVTAIYGRVL